MPRYTEGDRVIRHEYDYTGYPAGSEYNIPRRGMVVHQLGSGYVILKYPDGRLTPPLNPDCFDLHESELNLFGD